jgi:hypothetical protein
LIFTFVKLLMPETPFSFDLSPLFGISIYCILFLLLIGFLRIVGGIITIFHIKKNI